MGDDDEIPQTVPTDQDADPRPEMFVVLARHKDRGTWTVHDEPYPSLADAELAGRQSVGYSYDRFIAVRIPGAGI